MNGCLLALRVTATITYVEKVRMFRYEPKLSFKNKYNILAVTVAKVVSIIAVHSCFLFFLLFFLETSAS